MRKLVGSVFLSLDGVMQAPGGPDEDPSGGFALGGWVFPHGDSAINARIGALFAAPFELLLGRKTYEIFAAYWPYAPADHPIAGPFNATAKHVVTRSTAPLAWENSRAISGDIAAAIAALKARDGPDLLVQGSSRLYPLLLAHGLIDRLSLLTYPVVLGSGKRLFGEGTPAGGWRMIEHAVSSTGAIMASYEPVGAVPVGSFERDAPSTAELARRERMRREG